MDTKTKYVLIINHDITFLISPTHLLASSFDVCPKVMTAQPPKGYLTTQQLWEGLQSQLPNA